MHPCRIVDTVGIVVLRIGLSTDGIQAMNLVKYRQASGVGVVAETEGGWEFHSVFWYFSRRGNLIPRHGDQTQIPELFPSLIHDGTGAQTEYTGLIRRE